MKRAFFDIDTQIDFMCPAGSLYVPGAERVVDNIAALNRFAAAHAIPVISTMDAHSEDDPEFKAWPPHCVVGTAGQQKPASTLLDKRVIVPNAPDTASLDGAHQILLEKQTFDCFSNVNLEGLLAGMNADCYVVYGVVTEICVRMAVEGLLKTGKRVELVADAVKSLNDEKAAGMTASLLAAGGVLTTVSTVTR